MRAGSDEHAVKAVAQLVAVVRIAVRVGDRACDVGTYEVALNLVSRGFGIRDKDAPSAVAGDYVTRCGCRPPDSVGLRVAEDHALVVAQPGVTRSVVPI